MQNGSRKTTDTRYQNLYKGKNSYALGSKQMPSEVCKTPPADIKAEYKNERTAPTSKL